MSYILNALRKSEQERQAVAPDTVTNRILSPQPQRPQGPSKLIVALIISNLLIVAYFIWFNQKAPSVVTPGSGASTSSEAAPAAAKVEAIAAAKKTPAAVKPAASASASMKAAPAQPAAKTEAIDSGAAHKEAALAAAVTKSPSIADIAAAKKAPELKPPAKPVVEKKPAVAPIIPPSPEEEPETPAIVESSTETAGIKPAAAPAKNEIPFLHELPAQFRRSVPKMNINVFVYAKEPAERFVMIDMVKYRTGQLIKDTLELNEIRPDSLVVRYRNQAFQIERP